MFTLGMVGLIEVARTVVCCQTCVCRPAAAQPRAPAGCRGGHRKNCRQFLTSVQWRQGKKWPEIVIRHFRSIDGNKVARLYLRPLLSISVEHAQRIFRRGLVSLTDCPADDPGIRSERQRGFTPPGSVGCRFSVCRLQCLSSPLLSTLIKKLSFSLPPCYFLLGPRLAAPPRLLSRRVVEPCPTNRHSVLQNKLHMSCKRGRQAAIIVFCGGGSSPVPPNTTRLHNFMAVTGQQRHTPPTRRTANRGATGPLRTSECVAQRTLRRSGGRSRCGGLWDS